ncbi:MAG: S8 family serine peptidase, partial [Verrucomicrobiota bacterium]|nr:S8 family serine peptidase [Verrucomicrobiota bacterium]
PPNDPYWLSGSLWGMERIQVQEPWQELALLNDPTVVVASIDTGVNYNNPDLAASMWHNPGEIPGNGIDDDGNGYIDDVYGIDTYNHDSDPIDDYGHGTHTAGTMAATGNNGIGVAGVHWRAQIIACKFISAQDEGTDAGAIECLNYLIALKQRGVNIRVTNNSWGDARDLNAEYPAALQAAFAAATDAGMLNFCAAGNYAHNNDAIPFDPATFPIDGIVALAASDESDNRAYFSNYGATSVDFAAPGTSTLSTMGGDYGYLSGTSMATPHAAGSAALIAEFHPEFSPLTLKSLLMGNVDVLPQWSGLTATGGRLNLARAFAAAAQLETTLQIISVSQPSAHEFQITWVAVPGGTYRVSSAASPAGPFTPLSDPITAGAGQTSESYTDANADGPARFYRVELVP